MNKLRWGILGAANIARKNWKAIALSGNSTVVAVASRELEKGRQFIAECQADTPMESVPRAFGSYQELLASDSVDAVYIPLPTGVRKAWVVRAAEAGKQVVCEKPCAASVADLREMLEACRRRHVQFLDGVMFMHSRRLEALRQLLLDGQSVGDVRRIASAFTFRQSPEFFADNIRVHSGLEPFGCLGDLGWYCLRFALWLMDWQLPADVSGRLMSAQGRPDSPAPVPTGFCGELWFAGGVSADFYCSFHTETEQWVKLSGTQGCLHLSDFVLPFAGSELSFEVYHARFEVSGCDFSMRPDWQSHRVPEHSHGHATAQEANLYRNFTNQVRSGQLNPTWPEAALKTQIVMEACLESARDRGKRVRLASA